MKQEEAIAAAQKENEAIATAAHKAAAAEALAAGHPGVKVSMSQPGISDGAFGIKKQRTMKNNGVARRKNIKGKMQEIAAAAAAAVAAVSAGHPHPQQTTIDSSSFYHTHDHSNDYTSHAHSHTQSAGPSSSTTHMPDTIDSHMVSNGHGHTQGHGQVDLHLVQQAMQAAAGQMDELEMGMQLPIEMQMHGGEHDEEYQFGVGVDGTVGGVGVVSHHPYTPHGEQGFDASQYGYTGQGGVYGHGYEEGQ